MSKVKICGIRRFEDIEYANSFKPDYIGLIFAESKRRVSIEAAETLTETLDSGIKKVGVFVNEEIDNIFDIVRRCNLDVIQLHGDESSEYVDALRRVFASGNRSQTEVWKAIRVKDLHSVEQMKYFKVDAFVMDTFVEGAYGGAGKIFDWELAKEAKKYGKIFLAGGLNPRNVREAIQTVGPYGVDTSSGVETEGFKDGEKIRDFVCNVRETLIPTPSP